MSDPVVGTSELFTLLTDKSDVVGTTSVYFSNRGGVVLVWWLTLFANLEDAPWVASMYEGQLPAGETAEITLTLNTTLLQARNNPYLTSFILNSTSPTPTPVPITRSLDVGLRAIVSASPDPEESIITLHNVSSLTASGTIVVDVVSVDSTGRTILDASSVAYTGILTHNASTTTVTCAFAYDASLDCHRSYCALPPLKEGSFTLRVNDGDGVAVGGESSHFTISRCPPTYALGGDEKCACDPGSYDTGLECARCAAGFYSKTRGAIECTECVFPTTANALRTDCSACVATYYQDDEGQCQTCPEHVECPAGSQIQSWILHAGYWRASATATDVLPCRFAKESCPGIANKSSHSSSAPDSYCAEGHIGPLCSECSAQFFVKWTGGGCEKCDKGKSHAPSIGLGILLVVMVALIAGGCYLKRLVLLSTDTMKRVEDVMWVGESKMTILFFTAQVLNQFSIISSGTDERSGRYPEPAAT